jgi:hypothetical protein
MGDRMRIRRVGGRALAVAIALAGAAGVRAADSGDRIGNVFAARIELQRLIGDWLTKCLAGAAEPYRVEAIVQLELRGSIRELRSKQESAIPSVKIGGKNRVKLPGLGMVEGGGGQGNLMPEITVDGGTRVSETVSRQLETEVARLKINLFVDPSMPKERRELLVQLVNDLAGTDRARGDEVLLREWPETAKPNHGATVVQATIQSKVNWEILAICGSAILAAIIVALGIRATRSTSVVGIGGGGRGGGAFLERRAAELAEARSGRALAVAPRAGDEALLGRAGRGDVDDRSRDDLLLARSRSRRGWRRRKRRSRRRAKIGWRSRGGRAAERRSAGDAEAVVRWILGLAAGAARRRRSGHRRGFDRRRLDRGGHWPWRGGDRDGRRHRLRIRRGETRRR